jgi:hypothetical protein
VVEELVLPLDWASCPGRSCAYSHSMFAQRAVRPDSPWTLVAPPRSAELRHAASAGL